MPRSTSKESGRPAIAREAQATVAGAAASTHPRTRATTSGRVPSEVVPSRAGSIVSANPAVPFRSALSAVRSRPSRCSGVSACALVSASTSASTRSGACRSSCIAT